MSLKIHFPWWSPPLIIAIIWRLIVLASGAVSFHSDEAIIGLMARHINQAKPIPTFFYGQAYMGSLDPLLVSLMFRVTGETVLGIRLVQSILFLLFVATSMMLTFRLSGQRRVAMVAGLLVALPTPVMTLYTTISLGGYGETLVIGNLLLLVGYEIGINRSTSWKHWLALGALAGLGWWTNSLIIVYVLPVAVWLIILLVKGWQPLCMIAIAFAAFIAFSSPWWFYNLSHDWESVRFLLGGFQGIGQPVGMVDKLLGFVLFGMPAILGLRFSWTPSFWIGWWAIPIVILYIVLLILSLLRTPRSSAILFLWSMVLGYIIVFVLSNFGVDATGRYLLPLTVPLVIIITMQIPSNFRHLTSPRRFEEALPLSASSEGEPAPTEAPLRQRRGVGVRFSLPAIIVLIGINVLGTIIAMRTVPPGLTPQFDPATDFPNDYDQQVIDFLREHNGRTGYATYWATYRLVFLSHETVKLSPQLPYKATLVYTPQDRYPAYTAEIAQAERPVYVTANLPELDTAIANRLNMRAIMYSRQAIGPFTIFYDLSTHVTPAELGLQNLTGAESTK
jgi:hypothetical protein